MPSFEITYADGTKTSVPKLGAPKGTLLDLLKEVKARRIPLGYGVLKVNGETQGIADFDKELHYCDAVEFATMDQSVMLDFRSL